MKKNSLLFEYLLVTLIGFLCFVLGFLIASLPTSEGCYIKGELSPVKGNYECSNSSLQNTSYCLLNTISPFFKYNLSNRYQNLTDLELFEKGGVCWQWSEFYGRQLDTYGFDTEQVIIKMGNGSHQFAVASDNETYCILDQTKVFCI
jgi:hypothetical protein